MNERLYRKERIKKKSEVSSFFTNKSNTIFLSSRKYIYSIIIRPNDFDYSRFAVSVKKNKGKAPVRNRAKRQIREIFRKNRDSIPIGYDYFVIVNNVAKLQFDERAEIFLSTLLKVRS